jgi:tryptophan halogenase
MRICIIGGGTAGWLAALYINRRQPSHVVTVIESSRIPIIGAGEGSTGTFADLIHNHLGIDLEDFMLKTGATQKMGIRFDNWKGDGRQFIGPIDNTHTCNINVPWDTQLMHHCLHGPGREKAHLSTICGSLADRSLSSANRYTSEIAQCSSYHFDGHRVGQYFKEVAVGRGVGVIDSEYLHCVKDEQGFITSVKLVNQQIIEADLWIDATGFARVLGNEVDAGWHSYSDSLSCNRAMPFLLPHSEVIAPLTEAQALSSGWMWRIPTQERRGCGYVYDSNFLSDDQALQELEQTLGRSVDPIRVIKFDPGRTERSFCKNVISIGLAGSFLEPLQATSIHGTLVQLDYMMTFWLRDHGGPVSEQQNNMINQKINQMVDHFADLIQLHYRSGRSDTEFWKYQQTDIALRPQLEYIKDVSKHRWPNYYDWNTGYGIIGYGVFIYPMLEYDWINFDNVKIVNEKTKLEYEKDIKFIQSVVNNSITHTELVHRLQKGYVKPQPNIINSLHPLLKNIYKNI